MKMSSRLTSMPARSMVNYPGKNWVVPESVNDVVSYLDTRRPEFTCVYFHASWNPTCAQVNEDYDNFTKATGSFTHIKVDCDATPKVKFFFDARVEP